MKLLDEYLQLSTRLACMAFCEKLPSFVLLKRGRANSMRLPATTERFAFATQQMEVDQDPLADVWQVLPIEKRPGNPFPERLSLGRASNCDLVIRVPFVSKVHAHILLPPDGRMTFRAGKTSNGTFFNRARLSEGEERSLHEGDEIGLGHLALEVMSSSAFYDFLRGNAHLRRPAAAR